MKASGKIDPVILSIMRGRISRNTLKGLEARITVRDILLRCEPVEWAADILYSLLH